MVEKIDAYRIASGRVFTDKGLAEQAELDDALNILYSLAEKKLLGTLVAGSMSETDEDALRLIVNSIPPRARPE